MTDKPHQSNHLQLKERGEGYAQILHDRARESTLELRKLLISLSTGVIAIYFLSLTGQDNSTLSLMAKIWSGLSLILMGFSTLSGLLFWYANSVSNYAGGSARQAEKKEKQKRFSRMHKRWQTIQNLASFMQMWSFALGIIFSVLYGIERLF